jgi:tRNA (adenine37-N6)-methyltransferase
VVDALGAGVLDRSGYLHRDLLPLVPQEWAPPCYGARHEPHPETRGDGAVAPTGGAAFRGRHLARQDSDVVREDELRQAEVAVTSPPATDAGLVFIGAIHTPWTSRLEAPRQGRPDGPVCRIEVFEPWTQALIGLEDVERVEVLYWLHLSRRDLVLQSPRSDGEVRGTFALRSPVRPNPIGTSIASVDRIEGSDVYVRGLDCLDGTPLLDLKPDRTQFVPLAPPQPGDSQVE